MLVAMQNLAVRRYDVLRSTHKPMTESWVKPTDAICESATQTNPVLCYAVMGGCSVHVC